MQSALFYEIDDAQLRAHLFIGGRNEIDRTVEIRIFSKECFAGAVRTGERAFVVERSAAENLAVLDCRCERIRFPQFRIAGGNDIHMTDESDRAFSFADLTDNVSAT